MKNITLTLLVTIYAVYIFLCIYNTGQHYKIEYLYVTLVSVPLFGTIIFYYATKKLPNQSIHLNKS